MAFWGTPIKPRASETDRPESAARVSGIDHSTAPSGLAGQGMLSFACIRSLGVKRFPRFARLRSGKSFGANPKDLLAQALREAFPSNAAKQIARMTGVHVRTVEGWLAGNTAPDYENLLKLLRGSPLVFAMICEAAGRPEAAHADAIARQHKALADLLLPRAAGSAGQVDPPTPPNGLNAGNPFQSGSAE